MLRPWWPGIGWKSVLCCWAARQRTVTTGHYTMPFAPHKRNAAACWARNFPTWTPANFLSLPAGLFSAVVQVPSIVFIFCHAHAFKIQHYFDMQLREICFSPASFAELLIYCTPDYLLLDRSPNIGPLISRWELDKLKNCWNKSFRTSKILTILYQQFLNLLISQRDKSGSRLGAVGHCRIIGDRGAVVWWYNRRTGQLQRYQACSGELLIVIVNNSWRFINANGCQIMRQCDARHDAKKYSCISKIWWCSKRLLNPWQWMSCAVPYSLLVLDNPQILDHSITVSQAYFALHETLNKVQKF
jgi:hypothetical protein